MIAKVVTHAADRPTALAALHAALSQLQARGYVVCCAVCVSEPPRAVAGRLAGGGACGGGWLTTACPPSIAALDSPPQVGGLPTNAAFLRRICENEEFAAVSRAAFRSLCSGLLCQQRRCRAVRAKGRVERLLQRSLNSHGPLPPSLSAVQGAVDTGFIAKHQEQLLGTQPPPASVAALAALAFLRLASAAAHERSGGGGALPGPWGQPSSFRLNHLFSCPVAFTHPLSGTQVRALRAVDQ